jgi:hypothetical protein
MTLEFKGGSISAADWEGIRAHLEGVESVLEFGAGMSTKLFCAAGLKVVSLETNNRWIARVGHLPAEIHYWDNFTLPPAAVRRYDLAFVDGAEPRDHQVILARQMAAKIIVHDGGRPQERALIAEHLADWREVSIAGRCRCFVKPPAAYAALTSCSANYIQYLTALLNSLDRLDMAGLDVHVVLIDMPAAHVRRLQQTRWSFRLVLQEKTYDDFPQYAGRRDIATKARYGVPETLISKKCRYERMAKLADYRAALFLDADMMVVNDLRPFFELVEGTDLIVGCNEGFKWNMSRFKLGGETLPSMHMHWMICNAPLFFDPRRHRRLMEEIRHANENLVDGHDCSPGDLYCLNIALWRTGLTGRIVALPSHSWTGTHQGYLHWTSRIFQSHGRWVTRTGEPVYIIHGRWDRDGAENYHLNELEKRYDELGLDDDHRRRLRKQAGESVRQIKRQYHELIQNGKLPLKEP